MIIYGFSINFAFNRFDLRASLDCKCINVSFDFSSKIA